MIKKELIEEVARRAQVTKKESRQVVDTFLEEIKKALSRGEKVVLSGFGTFRTVTVKDKEVVVPGSKERVKVASHRAPRFKPGHSLKKAVR